MLEELLSLVPTLRGYECFATELAALVTNVEGWAASRAQWDRVLNGVLDNDRELGEALMAMGDAIEQHVVEDVGRPR